MTLDGLSQRLDDHERDTAAGHKRLRDTITDLKDEMDRIGEEQRDTASELRLLKQTPVDATKLVLSTRSILIVVGAAITIAASYWNLSTKLDTQQRAMEAASQLQIVQMKALGDSVADAKATAAKAASQYELLRYDLQALRDTVIEKRKQP